MYVSHRGVAVYTVRNLFRLLRERLCKISPYEKDQRSSCRRTVRPQQTRYTRTGKGAGAHRDRFTGQHHERLSGVLWFGSQDAVANRVRAVNRRFTLSKPSIRAYRDGETPCLPSSRRLALMAGGMRSPAADPGVFVARTDQRSLGGGQCGEAIREN